MQHDVFEPQFNCSVCMSHYLASLKRKPPQPDTPECWTRGCRVRHIMHACFDPWLQVFRTLRSDLVATNGLGRILLEQADATDANSIQLLAAMDGAYQRALEEARAQERTAQASLSVE